MNCRSEFLRRNQNQRDKFKFTDIHTFKILFWPLCGERKKLICDCFLFFTNSLYFFFCPIKWFCSCLLFDIDFVCVLFCTAWLSINSHCVLRNFVLLLFSFDLIWIFDLNYLSYWMQTIKTPCIPQQYYVRWNKKYIDFTAITHKNFFSLCFHSHWILQFQIIFFFSKTNTHFMHYDIFITIISTEWQFYFFYVECVCS